MDITFTFKNIHNNLYTHNAAQPLIVPPNLGFGENGLPGLVPGGSILIYDVELLSFSEH